MATDKIIILIGDGPESDEELLPDTPPPEPKNCKTTYPINPATDFNDWMQYIFNPQNRQQWR